MIDDVDRLRGASRIGQAARIREVGRRILDVDADAGRIGDGGGRAEDEAARRSAGDADPGIEIGSTAERVGAIGILEDQPRAARRRERAGAEIDCAAMPAADAEQRIGARMPAAPWIALGFLAAGAIFMAGGVLLITGAIRSRRASRSRPA